MFHKLLALFCVLSMTAFAADVQKKTTLPPRARTGVIINADFTAVKPSAKNSSAVWNRSSRAWAVLSLQLDAGRAASVFDYVLRKDGTEYPCLDMAMGEDEFNGMRRCDRIMESGKICRLVFAIPNTEDIYELVFKLDPQHESPVKLNVPVKKEEPPAPPAKEEPSAANPDAKSADMPADKPAESKPAKSTGKPAGKPQSVYGKAIQKAKDISKKAAGKK